MSSPPEGRRVHDLLATTSPTAAAVRDATTRWTYAELDRRSRAAAAWLAGRGVRPGDRVAVHASWDCRVVALLYACSRLGAVFVPLSVGMRANQRDHLLRDAAPAVTLTDLDIVPSGSAEPAPPTGPADAPAMLLYTSGSTARPKGVICPQEAVLFAVAAIAERLAYRADDVILCRLPLSFDYGLYQVFLCAMAGADLVLAGPNADAALVSGARGCGATVMPLVPSLATLLLRLAGRDHKPTRLRLFTNTGETLPEATIAGLRARFPGASVQLMYGITECKRVSIMEPDGDRHRPGALGRPLTGTRVTVVGPDGGPLPAGETGELVVAGPHLMAGYWRDPELTARVFGRDPATGEQILRTGDFGHLDADGYLHFAGRTDALFKRNGVRMSTVEIEAAAREVEGVHDAAVVPPRGDGDLLVLAVTELAPAEVLRALRGRLEPEKVPTRCQVVGAIPYGSTGKIDRTALRVLSLSGAPSKVEVDHVGG